MRRSNRNFNKPSPPPPPFPGKPRAFNILCARVGKIEPEVSGFQMTFFSGDEVANNYKTCVWTRWKNLKKRHSICERLVYKKGIQKLSSKEFWIRNSSLSYDRVNTIWYVFHTPISLLELWKLYVSVRGNQPTDNTCSRKRSRLCGC